MNLMSLGFIFVGLTIVGIILSILISTSICQKMSVMSSIPEGISWSLPISIVYFLLNARYGEAGYPSSLILPIFVEPMRSISSNPDFIGQVYAMLLITCVVTTRMYHTTDVTICVKTKDELKQFAEDLSKNIKEKKKDSVTK